MKNAKTVIVLLIAALALIVSACGSGDSVAESATSDVDEAAGDSADEAADEAAAPTTTVAALDAVESDGDDDQPTSVDDTPEDDGSTTTEITTETTIPPDSDADAEPDPDTDEPVGELSDVEVIEQLLANTPLEGTEDTSECIVAEFESEGIEVSDDLADPLVLALFRCETEAMTALMFEDFGGIDSSSIAATPQQIDCALEATIDWLAQVPLSDADTFATGDAPQEVVDAVVDTCNISESDAEFLLNEA